MNFDTENKIVRKIQISSDRNIDADCPGLQFQITKKNEQVK